MDANDLMRFRMMFKFTQKQAAKAIGCSARAIENWEKRIAPIPRSVAMAARAFSMDPYPLEDKIANNLPPWWRPALRCLSHLPCNKHAPQYHKALQIQHGSVGGRMNDSQIRI
jgi:DNA-binding XRE family transcriptional regulator